MRQTIEVPDPIIESIADYNPDGINKRQEWKARIVVGGVHVMERFYTSEWTYNVHPQPDDFVETAGEAADKIAAEFGNKLKELMSK